MGLKWVDRAGHAVGLSRPIHCSWNVCLTNAICVPSSHFIILSLLESHSTDIYISDYQNTLKGPLKRVFNSTEFLSTGCYYTNKARTCLTAPHNKFGHPFFNCSLFMMPAYCNSSKKGEAPPPTKLLIRFEFFKTKRATSFLEPNAYIFRSSTQHTCCCNRIVAFVVAGNTECT